MNLELELEAMFDGDGPTVNATAIDPIASNSGAGASGTQALPSAPMGAPAAAQPAEMTETPVDVEMRQAPDGPTIDPAFETNHVQAGRHEGEGAPGSPPRSQPLSQAFSVGSLEDDLAAVLEESGVLSQVLDGAGAEASAASAAAEAAAAELEASAAAADVAFAAEDAAEQEFWEEAMQNNATGAQAGTQVAAGAARDDDAEAAEAIRTAAQGVMSQLSAGSGELELDLERIMDESNTQP